jgi:hypothetical protein
MDTEIANEWAEAEAEERLITKWLPRPGARPLYARETFTAPVEPYYTRYQHLYGVIGDSLNNWATDDGEGRETWELPNENYWKPTAPMRAMLRELDALEKQAWRTVPNPEYDPVRAKEWEEKRQRCKSTTMYVGQSYNPEIPADMKVHAAGEYVPLLTPPEPTPPD